jgi:hypothetical protein
MTILLLYSKLHIFFTSVLILGSRLKDQSLSGHFHTREQMLKSKCNHTTDLKLLLGLAYSIPTHIHCQCRSYGEKKHASSLKILQDVTVWIWFVLQVSMCWKLGSQGGGIRRWQNLWQVGSSERSIDHWNMPLAGI